MAEEDVIIQIRAQVTQGLEDIKRLEGELRGLGAAGEKGATQAQSAWQGLKKSFTEINSAMQIARQGVEAVKQVYGAVISDTVAYNKEIRVTAQNLGISTEETSRIVQAMDDFGIEAGSVTTALEMMTKRGVAPSIDQLAKLSDQYNSISDPVQRAALMSEMLGRNWTALTPALKMGGDAIREAAAAIDDNLIATEAEIQATRNYEIAVDNLTDAWTGFKMTIGNAVIPTLTDAINLSMDAEGTLKKEAASKVDAAQTYADYKKALQEVANAHGLIIQKNGNLTTANGTLVASNFAISESLWNIVKAAEAIPDDPMVVRVRLQQDAHYTPYNPYDVKAPEGSSWTSDQVARRQAANQARLNEGLTVYHEALSGPVSKENKRFADQQKDIAERIGETQEKLAKLNKTPWKQEEIKQTQQDLTDLQGTQKETAEEHEKAQKQLILGYMEQQMAADGLTTQEVDGLLQVGQGWGLVDDETIKAWDTAKNFTQQITDAVTAADNVAAAVAGIPSYKEVIINVIVQGDTGAFMSRWGSGPGPSRQVRQRKGEIEEFEPMGGASGINTIVPPGYNENYFVGASSGERVKIIPPGKPEFDAGNGGNITIYGRTTIINGRETPTNRRAQLKSSRVG